MRNGCASDTRADLSLRALYTYLTSFSSGSLLFSIITLFSHTTKTVTSWADAQTAQIVSFEILVLLMAKNLQVLLKTCIYYMPKSPVNKA